MIVINFNRVTANIRDKTGHAVVKNLSNIGCFIYDILLLTLTLTINYELFTQACFISISALK